MFRSQAASLHSVLASVCLGVAILCLGAAYLLAGDWWILPIFSGMGILCVYLRKRSMFWSASSVLFVCALLAAIGIALDLSFSLLVLGCTASMAYWDLAEFQHSLQGSLSSPQELALEKHHLQSLATAVFAGLLFVSVGLLIELNIPFFFTLLLALTVVGCLTYGVWSILQDR